MTGSPMCGAGPVDTRENPWAIWRTLGLRDVAIHGGIWARRQAVNRESALRHGHRMLEAAGNLENLRIAAGRFASRYRGPVFMDSDVYKSIRRDPGRIRTTDPPVHAGPARIATELAPGQTVALQMETEYPWDGRVRLIVEDGASVPRSLDMRFPGWSQGAHVSVNGRPAPATPGPNGYQRLERLWMAGDMAEVERPMESRLIEAHPRIESTRASVAIARGPLIYCIEAADHPGLELLDLEIDATAPLSSRRDDELLDGVTVVQVSGFQVDTSSWSQQLNRPLHATGISSSCTASAQRPRWRPG